MLMLSNHLPSTRSLQCFLAVAQELNFRSAAEILHMSQPPLSRQIQGLEELLRVQLLQRNTRQVSLTPAGEAFAAEAHKLLMALDQAIGRIKEHYQDAQEGKVSVRVGLTSVINHSLIPRLDGLIHDPRFTEGRALERDLSRRLVERVRKSELDIAIVGDIEPPRDLKVESIGCEPMIVILPEAHPATRKQEVALSDLADIPLFWFSRADNPAFYDKCERTFRSHGYAPPRRPEPRDFTLLLASVAAGEGIGLCPQSMRATTRMGVTYRTLQPQIAQQLAIHVQIVSRANEMRPAVLNKLETIRCMLSGEQADEAQDAL